MRNTRIVVCLSAATLALGATVATAPAAASGGDTKRVRVTDDCDPASFNAVIGPGTCVGDGETTLGALIAELAATGAAEEWEFKPDDFHIDRGDRIKAVNVGGEFHTFTEVENFGGGCVEELNEILGLTPVPECEDPASFATGIPAGATLPVSGLEAGDHKFMCLIHPWMQSKVEVRADDDRDDDREGHH